MRLQRAVMRVKVGVGHSHKAKSTIQVPLNATANVETGLYTGLD